MIKVGSARTDENCNANWGKVDDQTGRYDVIEFTKYIINLW